MIDTLAGIAIQDKHMLSTKSVGKNKYYIPGGKREAGETDAAALCREIKEELSIDLLVETLQLVGTFKAQADGCAYGTLVQMTCYTASSTGTLKAAAEIMEIKWLSYADKDNVSAVDKIIFNFLQAKNLL